MTTSATALLPPTDTFGAPGSDQLESAPLDQLELAANHRKPIEPDAPRRPAHMLATAGQLTPCIGHRVATDRVIIHAGQRRLLAARASHELAGTRSSRASRLSRA